MVNRGPCNLRRINGREISIISPHGSIIISPSMVHGGDLTYDPLDTSYPCGCCCCCFDKASREYTEYAFELVGRSVHATPVSAWSRNRFFEGRGSCHKGQKGEAGWLASSNRFPNEPKTTHDPSGRFSDWLCLRFSGLSDGEQPLGGGPSGSRYRYC